MNTTTTTIMSMDTIAEAYRTDRLELGPTNATRQWARETLGAWLDQLTGRPTKGNGWKPMLATLMRESLPVRDAMIYSVLSPLTSRDTIIRLASEAHTPDMKRLSTSILDHALRDPKTETDHALVSAAVSQLRDIAATADSDQDAKYKANVLATIAYLEWVDGRQHDAMLDAQDAADHDKDNTLAGVVGALVVRDVHPAYLD
ncbi:hypothetical protein [Bifidobacterium biavatii]|uniref:Uncharacterized protein n=1 Tax=Bifidobacterium biavatii DSM 23969 TaxID=1437608 RepID=A0A086ZHX0_9BIFI|nr:hypothetical protein [Bifidobacterium biavatii]KFI46120.1 hypothetical protein BBIA_2085 [Bifidobacterium biavatii DSM 23969]